ncbi:MAG: hypothetical protein GY747_01305 [Planctomycetes bacterium]|nr:hypothetical protein [Planctomycetota bacterium]MCP4769864.1 hypothetical protein [Planctomycetota bacterium]MCP4859704.1 hypothetical protein [Planctomycetota bacterium]
MKLHLDGRPLTFSDVFHYWQESEAFRSVWIELLASIPFQAFRWELPAVTTAQLEKAFECALLEDDSLHRSANCTPFVGHFITSNTKEVLGFPNLGSDAFMIVPRPGAAQDACAHLASFSRSAPAPKQHALWEAVGEAMEQRVGPTPIWLSTAGDGVAWLHVRLDDAPKYYGHAPYRNFDVR